MLWVGTSGGAHGRIFRKPEFAASGAEALGQQEAGAEQGQ